MTNPCPIAWPIAYFTKKPPDPVRRRRAPYRCRRVFPVHAVVTSDRHRIIVVSFINQTTVSIRPDDQTDEKNEISRAAAQQIWVRVCFIFF